jgi:hypothetical protein
VNDTVRYVLIVCHGTASEPKRFGWRGHCKLARNSGAIDGLPLPSGERRAVPKRPTEVVYIWYCIAIRRVRNPLLTSEVTHPRLTGN